MATPNNNFDPTSLPGVVATQPSSAGASFNPTSLPGVVAAPAHTAAADPSSSGGPIPTLFPATGTESPLGAGLKTLGNLLPSAANFAVGAAEAPFKGLRDLTQIPAAVGGLVHDAGGILPAAGAFAKELPGQLIGGLIPEGAQKIVSGTAGSLTGNRIGNESDFQGAAKSFEENPFGNVAPFVLMARQAAYGHSPETGAAFDKSISTVASPVTAAGSALAKFIPEASTPESKLQTHVFSGGASKTMTRAYEDASSKTANPISTLSQNGLIKDIQVQDGKVNVDSLTNKQGTGSLDDKIEAERQAGSTIVGQMRGGVSLDAFEKQAMAAASQNPELQARGIVAKTSGEIARRFEDYRQSFGDKVTYPQIDRIRKSMNKVWDSDTWDAERAIGDASRKALYEGAGAPGALPKEHIGLSTSLRTAMRNEGELLSAKEFARKLHGTAVGGGKLGRYIASATGGAIGAGVGSIFPFGGPLVGAALGSYLTDKGVSRYQEGYFHPHGFRIPESIKGAARTINMLPEGDSSAQVSGYFKKNPPSLGLSMKDENSGFPLNKEGKGVFEIYSGPNPKTGFSLFKRVRSTPEQAAKMVSQLKKGGYAYMKQVEDPKEVVPKGEGGVPNNAILGPNDRVQLTDKATGRTNERNVHKILPDGTVVVTDDVSGIPYKVNPKKIDIKLLKSGDHTAPPVQKKGPTFAELNAMEDAGIKTEEEAQQWMTQHHNDLSAFAHANDIGSPPWNPNAKSTQIFRYSNPSETPMGESRFFSPDESAVEEYNLTGNAVKESHYVDESSLYHGESSLEFAQKHGLMEKPMPPELQKLTGLKTLKEVDDAAVEGVPASSGASQDYQRNPNIFYTAFQQVAAKELKAQGYKGARWSHEDDLTPRQYQIWDQSALGKKNDLSAFAPKENSEPLFHGTNNADEILKNGFSLNRAGSGSGYLGTMGKGVYLDRTPGAEGAKLYGKQVLKVKLKPGLKLFDWDGNLSDFYHHETKYGDPEEITKYMQKKGYDGIRNSIDMVIFDPKNVTATGVLKPEKPPPGTK